MVRLAAAIAAAACVLGCASASAVPSVQRPNAVPSKELLARFATAQVGEHFVEDHTIFIFRGMGEVNETDNKLHGRACCGCGPLHFTAVQVPSGQSGTWWGTWEPATGCYYTSQNSCFAGASVTRSWWSDGGFDTATADAVVAYINRNGSLNQGYSWATSNTASTGMSCCTGSNNVGQIWSQSLWGWSNSQEQSCDGNTCGGTSCGAWSAYQHANWALGVNGGTVNWGCSTGSNNVRC